MSEEVDSVLSLLFGKMLKKAVLQEKILPKRE